MGNTASGVHLVPAKLMVAGPSLGERWQEAGSSKNE